MSNKNSGLKYRHNLWGDGTLQKVEGTVLVIEFPHVGVKKISIDSVRNGVLTRITETENDNSKSPLVHNSNNFKQYDTSDTIIGGKNVLEAFESENVIIFNESYTILGDETSAQKISATYDLTVIGDLVVDEINVNGDLTVVGNIKVDKLTCANTLICKGHIDADNIYVGNIIAKSVKCVEFVCDGNALIETTIDIDEFSRTEKTMVACEGIMGAGTFLALNAIANEYFEFSGNVQGKVLELESDTTLSEMTAPAEVGIDLSEMTIEEVISEVEKRLSAEYKQCGNLDEEEIAELTKLLGNNTLHNLAEYSTYFDILTSISYQDEIDDFGDYLMVLYAKKILPNEIYKYETIEHIDSLMLEKAEKKLEELEFRPESVERIAQCIQIAIKCADDIPMSTYDVLDKIFSSFGLRYSTVKSALDKSYSQAPVKQTIIEEPVKVEPVVVTHIDEPVENDDVDMFDVEDNKPKKFKTTKKKFLVMSLQAEAKYFGITSDEQMRLASARVKTCGDFLRMSEQDFRELFKKKMFLANHLYQAQQKMQKAVNEMADE